MESDESEEQNKVDRQLTFFAKKSHQDALRHENSPILSKRDDESVATSSVIQTESIISDIKPANESDSISEKQTPLLQKCSKNSSVLKDKSETNSVTVAEDEIINQYTNNSAADEAPTNSSHFSIPSLNLNSLSQSLSEADKFSPGKKSGNSERYSPTELPESSMPSYKSNANIESLLQSISHTTQGEKANSINNNVSSVSHVTDDDHLSIDSSIHTHLDESAKSSQGNLSISNADLENVPIDNESISGSQSKSKSHLYLEESATDPPLQLNADAPDTINPDKNSSSSDEIIKLDIRGEAIGKRNFPFVSNIIFSNVDSIITPVNRNNFITLNAIPSLDANRKLEETKVQKSVTVLESEEILGEKDMCQSVNGSDVIMVDNDDSKSGNGDYQQDFDIEEMILNQSRDVFITKDIQDNDLFETQNKPTAEGEFSLSTVTTDYKTFHEDFKHEIPDTQKFLSQKVEELRSSLQQSVEQRDSLQLQNNHLVSEISKLQQLLSDVHSSGLEIKGQLSDFAKHENFIKEDSFDYITQSEGLTKKGESADVEASIPSPKAPEASEGSSNVCNSRLANIDDTFDTFCLNHSNSENVRDNVLSFLEKEFLSNFEKTINSVNDHLNKSNNADGGIKITLNEMLLHMKPENHELIEFFKVVEQKHQKEVEKLRTYFEERCAKMEKNYSEEIFSQHSKKLSTDSSMDSLDNCPEALPFGSPLHGAGDKGFDLPDFKIRRSHSAEFHLGLDEVSVLQKKIFNMKKEHQTQLKVLTSQHEMDINDLTASHELHFTEMEENYKNQIAELKAHLQTLENTDHGDFLHFEHRDTDLELEKALLSDPNAGLSNWPLEFIGLRDKVQAEMQQTIESLKVAHANELSAVQSENSQQLALITDKYKVEADKWKQKRNDAFDKNRKLEEAIKERDGLKRMTATLQKVLSQLVEYFNLCEDELNNTFVGELLRQIIDADDNFDNTIILSSFTTVKDSDSDHEFRENLDSSALSQISKHSKRMHFAPKVDGILPFIETESILDCLDKSQDVSVNFKHDLDYCLRRLKQEAQELLVLSSQAPKRLSILGSNDEQKPTKDYANADELLQEHNDLQDKYDKSEAIRKDLEESLAQSLYREEVLKGDLQVSLERFAELANPLHQDVISDRYGGASSPARLAAELQVATTEREDMQMRLEAANKQLRSTRQFLEEQAAEREHERDEFQRELKQLKDENSKLLVKTQQYVRISKEVDQLETQIKDMTNRISELETENSNKQSELAASEEKIGLLRDIIGNLENQMETKTSQEVEVLKDLDYFRLLAEEREMKIEDLTDELKASRNDMEKKITEGLLAANNKRTQNTNVENDTEKVQIEQMRSELQVLLKTLAEHTAALESLHEAVCSQSCSSPSEDVSIRDHKKQSNGAPSPLSVRGGRLPVLEVWQLGDGLQRHLRAEDAALKRIRDLEMQLVQLKDVAQELRMERDVLQERMSEQSLRISSLQSRLEQTRHTVEAQSYHSTEGLRRQLDQALAEGQLLREGLRSRDMQLRALEGTPDSSKEMVQKLRRELEENKSKCRELQKEVEISRHQQESLLADKNADIVVLRQQLLEKEKHLQAVLSLQIEDEREKDCNNDGKLSARTLSDILSISEFDEPDIVMRNAELRPQSFVSGQFIFTTNDTKEQTVTLLPDSDRIIPVAASSGLGITNQSPKDTSPAVQKEHSLPTLHQTTSPMKQENLSPANFKMLSDNCSMFPNKDASGDKNVTIQPKKIDFSISNLSEQNRIEKSAVKKANLSLNDVYVYRDVEVNFSKNLSNLQLPKSLKDLGIHIDTQQKVYPDILTQLKNEICLLREELNAKTSALKMAEEQLSEFPAVKDEMEELERVLQNSLETMQEDKKYFNIQLDNFAKGEQILKEQLENATSEVNEKSKEINILKDDILRRETMISEIYKEKRSVELKLSQMEERCQRFENDSVENHNLKKKLIELEKLEHMITEKNLQIDSLNENLDRLDDLQKRIMEEEDQNKKLTLDLIEKNAEVTQLQTKYQDLKYAEEQLILENSTLATEMNLLSSKNVELKNVLSKYGDAVSNFESDLENVIQAQDVKQAEQSSEATNEDIIKLQEYKWLLSGLEGQRSPAENIEDEQANDHYQLKLNTLRTKVQTLQNNFISKRKELSAKVLQLEKAKLEIEDLQKQVEYLKNDESDKDSMLKELVSERLNLRANLKILKNQLSEEGNLEELRDKLNRRTEECNELQDVVAKLTEAAKKHEADSLLSIERDRHLQELLLENERLKQALGNVKKMLAEREIQFNNILTSVESQKSENLFSKDTQTSFISEIDNHVWQNQDSEVVKILKDQLESAIEAETELQTLLEREKSTTDHLEMQVKTLKRQVEQLNETLTAAELSNNSVKVKKDKMDRIAGQLEDQVEISESLKSEMMSLRVQLDNEKAQFANLQTISDREKHKFSKNIEEYKNLIAELQKSNHELHLQMVHSSEMLHLQKNENANLEKKLSKILHSQRRLENAETYEALLELENLLRRNINENIQMSETVRELTLERRELQAKVKVLENQIKMGGKYSQSLANLPEGLDQQVRFLYGRYMRVDSYRKALVWQKRYLMGVANASYLLQHWRNPSTSPTTNRFKCVTLSIIAVFRMKYLVRRWHTGNRIGANIHLNIPNVYPTELRNSKSYTHLPTSSYVREKSDVQKTNNSFDELKSTNRPSAKPSNKSWTVSSKTNVSSRNQDEGLSSHHNKMDAFLEEAVPHKLKPCAQPSERCHSTNASSRLQEQHPEPQDAYGIKYLNSQSRNEMSPIVSKYLEKISQLDAKLQRALKSPRDPP